MSSRGAPGIEYAYFPLCCYVMKFGETSTQLPTPSGMAFLCQEQRPSYPLVPRGQTQPEIGLTTRD